MDGSTNTLTVTTITLTLTLTLGVKSHALAEFVDIFPTVVDVAGLEPVQRCNYSLHGDVTRVR